MAGDGGEKLNDVLPDKEKESRIIATARMASAPGAIRVEIDRSR